VVTPIDLYSTLAKYRISKTWFLFALPLKTTRMTTTTKQWQQQHQWQWQLVWMLDQVILQPSRHVMKHPSKPPILKTKIIDENLGEESECMFVLQQAFIMIYYWQNLLFSSHNRFLYNQFGIYVPYNWNILRDKLSYSFPGRYWFIPFSAYNYASVGRISCI